MLCSILQKSVSSKTLVTIKSFSSIHRQSKLSSLSNFINEFNSLSIRPHATKFLPSFSSRRLCSKISQDSVELLSDSHTPDETEASLFRNVDYEAITNNDPELTKKLKIILAEIYVMYEEGKEIPSEISTKRFIELLHLKSRTARSHMLKYLFVIEKKKESDAAKKLVKREEYEKYLVEKDIKGKTENPSEKLSYSLSANSLFLRIYDASIDKYNNFTMLQSQMFGPKLIIDCGYTQYMISRECKMCAKQLMMGFGDNRKHNFPLHLAFHNYNKNDLTSEMLLTYMPTMYDPTFPIEFHSESYLNVYPKENLVYLTPHCKEELKTVRGKDIFVIGAMVDAFSHDQRSLGKAKEEGIRMAKFPVDQYLDWGSGTKNFTINQCIMILTEMYWRNDWKYAFDQWIPKRKLTTKDQTYQASRYRNRIGRNNEANTEESEFRLTDRSYQRRGRGDFGSSPMKRHAFESHEPEVGNRSRFPPRRFS